MVALPYPTRRCMVASEENPGVNTSLRPNNEMRIFDKGML